MEVESKIDMADLTGRRISAHLLEAIRLAEDLEQGLLNAIRITALRHQDVDRREMIEDPCALCKPIVGILETVRGRAHGVINRLRKRLIRVRRMILVIARMARWGRLLLRVRILTDLPISAPPHQALLHSQVDELLPLQDKRVNSRKAKLSIMRIQLVSL